MNQQMFEELISAYLDDELAPQQRAEVEQALRANESHRRSLAEFKAIRENLQGLSRNRLDDDFSNRVVRRAQRAMLKKNQDHQNQPPTENANEVLLPPSSIPVATPTSIPTAAISPTTPPPFEESGRLNSAVSPLQISADENRVSAAGYRRTVQSKRWQTRSLAAVGALAAAASILGFLLYGPQLSPNQTLTKLAPEVPTQQETEASSDRSGDSETGSTALPNTNQSAELKTKGNAASSPDQKDKTKTGLPTSPPQKIIIIVTPSTPQKEKQPTEKKMKQEKKTENMLDEKKPPLKIIESPFRQTSLMPGDVIVVVDANHDGTIVDSEVRAAIEPLQILANAKRQTEAGAAILQALDADQDGQLDSQESLQGAVMARLNVAGLGKQVSRLCATLDYNADGRLDPDEFKQLVGLMQQYGPAIEPKLGSLFATLDADDDSLVTLDESQSSADAFSRQIGLQGPAQSVTMIQLSKTMMSLDRNKDGKLSRREAGRDKMLKEMFDMLDSNMDKVITAGEMYDYLRTKNPLPPNTGLIRFTVPRAR